MLVEVELEDVVVDDVAGVKSKYVRLMMSS